jgi:sarcosine oxidase
MRYSVGIIGLGAMGSATAWSLAQQGVSVIGFEQFGLGHQHGSSHGKTRIIRSVYFEGEVYAPLVDAAYRAWTRIEETWGQAFYRKTGGLDISLADDGGVFHDALSAAQAAGRSFDVLEGSQIEDRFPALDLGGRGRAVYAADSGLLDSDDATNWMRDMAARRGAVFHANCPVQSWTRTARGFEIQTSTGSYQVRKLIIAAGAWVGQLLPELAPVLVPERQVVAWYHTEQPGLASLPIFQLETRDRERYYAFPPHRGYGLKLGLYNHRRQRGPEFIEPSGIDDDDRRLLEHGLDLCLPGVDRKPDNIIECRFTNAPDERFVIGKWPEDEDLIILSPCSGHGYKFAPVIGDIAADLALEVEPCVEIGEFAVKRVV